MKIAKIVIELVPNEKEMFLPRVPENRTLVFANSRWHSADDLGLYPSEIKLCQLIDQARSGQYSGQ